ncbi:uncharacterized protein BXZ73DRAFT_57724, partial [Epithele typhae]|uniref:uncharacterized protein n=1 Tax=Epithele typhae TaxID=378194 RepID=UPI002008AA7C
MARCPIEIFTEIFQCVIRLSDPPDPYHKPSTEWLRLLLVSRAWRDTILKTKSLWSTIQVHGENGERWLKLSLDRARSAAISISIDFENIPYLGLTPLLEHASDIRSVRL